MRTCSTRFVSWEPCGRNKREENKLKSFDISYHPTAEKVYVIGSGGGYYHFINEALPRMAPFIDELLSNPTIKIHLNYDNKYVRELMLLLGFGKDRLIQSKSVYSKFTWIPEGTLCCCTRRLPMVIIAGDFIMF